MINPQHFLEFVAVNINNNKLSDKEFRQVLRNTLKGETQLLEIAPDLFDSNKKEN